MQEKRIGYKDDFLYLRVSDTNILKLDVRANVIEENCSKHFLEPSAPEQELSDTQCMALGIIGEGCGGDRVFIVDSSSSTIVVYNLEDKSTQTLIENIAAPDGICKVMCRLYISSLKHHSLYVFDLSKMHLETFEIKYR